MLPGFNHNIRHKGVLFHVQTEDSGFQNPVVVTHVFHGGNIVATRRRSYEKFIQATSLDEIVTSMMKEQHKDVMKDIVNERFKAVQDVLRSAGVEVSPDMRKEEITVPQPASPEVPLRTLDADTCKDKTLDELILDFLMDEQKRKP